MDYIGIAILIVVALIVIISFVRALSSEKRTPLNNFFAMLCDLLISKVISFLIQ